ncbi:MAG TPA: rod shape-determining protein [bacterium (Candidatus Stahlbacteria)]|nr:rod shape-determining protein [Candidatus Stahlbacteria bacterium]
MFDFLKRVSRYFTNEVAVDLGTSTTLIYLRGKGIVLCEPSVVAVNLETKQSVAVGAEAKKMLGKTPHQIRAIRPMKDGVIADFEMVELMLRSFLDKTQDQRRLVRPKIIISVPSGITEVEKRAVRDSAEAAGARDVYLISEPLAAAIGVGLNVSGPSGNMVIDIGGGTTEIAVIALFGIVTNNSIRIGGDEIDEAVVQHIKKNYNIIIGDQTAEQIKINIGSAFPINDEEEIEVRGRDLVSGIPKTIKITAREIREAIQEPIAMIIEGLRLTLEKTPPELASDIVDNGIYLTGGGSLLKGLDDLIREETNLPVTIADQAQECVVLGAGKVLENLDHYEKVLLKSR